MNHTLNIFDCQYAVKFIPINSLVRSKRRVLFFSRVSRYGQDHRKYVAALEAAHDHLNLPVSFILHKYTGCGQLDGNGKFFAWFSQKIPHTENVVCVFPALDRVFRPVGFDQFDKTTWVYRESDFELFRQKLVDWGCNPENITFALLNDGTLEPDRAFETRLGENYEKNQKQTYDRIDPKTSERLNEEVYELRSCGMEVPDIYFYLAIRLEQVAERTVRKWVQEMRLPSNWENMQVEARGLAYFEGKSAMEIHRRFILRGEMVSLRAVQYWVEGREAFVETRTLQDFYNNLS